jgi:hypothetical protein
MDGYGIIGREGSDLMKKRAAVFFALGVFEVVSSFTYMPDAKTSFFFCVPAFMWAVRLHDLTFLLTYLLTYFAGGFGCVQIAARWVLRGRGSGT